MKEAKPRALVIDDEEVIRDFLKRLLTLNGLEVEVVPDEVKAIELIRKKTFDIIFLDLTISNTDGLKVLKDIRDIRPRSNCVLMTSRGALNGLWGEAKKDGTVKIIEKPFQIEEIISQVSELCRKEKGETDGRT